MAKQYKVVEEHNQLRGIEASCVVLVVDQWGVVCDDRQIDRDAFENQRAYLKEIAEQKRIFKDEWCKPRELHEIDDPKEFEAEFYGKHGMTPKDALNR